jgi:hypothetical protein
MALSVRNQDLPYSAMEFYGSPTNYEPTVNSASMPIIPLAAAANPSKLLQPTIRTVGPHGGLSFLSRTPEEIAIRNSINQMLPHLNETYQARIRKQLYNAEHYIKGKKEGKDKPISMKNLVKVSQHSRELLARQIKVQAGFSERASGKAKRSVVSHSGGFHKNGTKIFRKGAAKRAYGKAKRARVKAVTAALLKGQELTGLALKGAKQIAEATKEKFLKKLRKDRSVGSELMEAAIGEVQIEQSRLSRTGNTRAPVVAGAV